TKRVSIALSGGIDSTLMLALLRKTFPDITIDAISIKFAESIDESIQAQKIADKFDANHKVLFIENYLKDLPKAISIIKLPFWDLHWYHVVKEASSNTKFLVSGDGGDELFGGYTFRYQKFLSLVNEKSSSMEKIKAYLECHERDWVPDQEKLFGEKLTFTWNDIYTILEPYFENQLPSLGQVFLADFNGKLLYNWTPLYSKLHQYFKMTSIAPLLTNDLISYAIHLDYSLKYNEKNNIGKILLRKLLQKYIPETEISPSKQGFSVNTLNLWKSHGKKLCEYYLNDGRIIKNGLISKEWISIHLNKLESNDNIRYVNKFLGLLALEIWFRLFITKEMKSDETLD
ncbi:MAG TPA: asparagine synthase C-terminal domain-containing protein, partial [Candidatus Bathyarchaeia archaeon]|nr:asparagine synthase C-terminal domain-containing protein [Candidatus Bathyarchaeia archaeon]